MCELEEEANREFNLWILEEETAETPHARQSTLPSQPPAQFTPEEK